MITMRVLDSDLDTLSNEQYDVCLFASGYESRCVHIPQLIDPRWFFAMPIKPIIHRSDVAFPVEPDCSKKGSRHNTGSDPKF